ncbi:MAG: hypothetical protein OEZ38_04875 [Gammaproteobacteria bacterium]|nr:hypothetical protein [Gammaproteobacteria bacterium]
MSGDNIYSAPESDLNDGLALESGVMFFPTSQIKLIVLYISTFGMYPIYWFYKNWKLQKDKFGQAVIPALRSIFYIFFTHSLFRKIEVAADDKDIKVVWGGSSLATIFVLLTVLTNFLDVFTRNTDEIGMVDYIGLLMIFIILWPLYVIQGVVNRVNNDPEGKLNSSYSFYNIIFIVLGIPVWLLIIIGVFNIDVSFLADPMN